MNTIYGESPDQYWINYFKSLIGRCYKILPLKEENVDTLQVYIESLLRELIGDKNLAITIQFNAYFICLCATLQNLLNEDDINVYRRDVFKCIDLIKKIQSSIKVGDES